MTGTVKKAPAKKRKIVSLDKKKARAGWLFVLPFVIGFIFIYLPVIFDSIKLSFCEIKTLDGGKLQPVFVGFKNYEHAISTDPEFLSVLGQGLLQLLFDIPAIVIFSLFMAVLLNKKMFGRAAFRAIFFIPVILSTGVISAIDKENVMSEYMSTGGGIDDGSGSASGATAILEFADLSWLFSNMAVGGELLIYVTGVVNNIYGIINRSGVQMLIFLAGLQSISPAIYESCSIDGATGWETFWKITFPMISPMILVNTVYTVIDSFTAETNSVMTYINSVWSSAGGRTVSSAMSWMYFMIVIVCIAVVSAVVSGFVFYQKRD